MKLEKLDTRLEMQTVILPDGTAVDAADAEAACAENCGSCSGSECLVR
ncbi:hypothetical protein [Pseudoalteromonas 'SMAR']